VHVRKKSGEICLCVDFRNMNMCVVGKSPCGQVDCLKEIDPNSKTESA
jgi:hypothetical protein